MRRSPLRTSPVLCLSVVGMVFALFPWGCLVASGNDLLRGGRAPDRPESHIFDDARFFSDAEKTRLSKHLIKLRDEAGIEIFVTVVLYTPEEGIDALAIALAEQWIGAGRGMVLVYDPVSKELSFASSERINQDLPHYTQIALFRKEVKKTGRWNDFSQNYISVAKGLGDSLAVEVAQIEKRRRIRYGAINLLLPAGISGCLFLFWIALRKRPESGEFTPEPLVPVELLETDPLEGFRFFPSVTVGCRLGAACGGGSPNELAPQDAARGAPDLPQPDSHPFL